MRFRQLFLTIVILLGLTACSGTRAGNPTAKDILKSDPAADILRVGELVYAASNTPAGMQRKLEKGQYIGEIKKQTDSPYFFHDFYATRLEKGSKIYSTDKDGSQEDTLYILIVEEDGELYEYHALLEG